MYVSDMVSNLVHLVHGVHILDRQYDVIEVYYGVVYDIVYILVMDVSYHLLV